MMCYAPVICPVSRMRFLVNRVYFILNTAYVEFGWDVDMSDNTQDSGSFRKNFRPHGSGGSANASFSIKRGFDSISSSLSRGVESFKKTSSSIYGKTGKSDSVFSRGTLELDKYGYERYNIQDGQEIYISMTPRTADFEDDYLLVRGTAGNPVGSRDTGNVVSVNVNDAERKVDAESLFRGVSRGTSQTEFKGVTGTVEGDHVKPTPIDRSILDKMAARNYRPAPRMEAEQPVAEEPKVDNGFMSKIKTGSEVRGMTSGAAAIDGVDVEVPESPAPSIVIDNDDESPIIMQIEEAEEIQAQVVPEDVESHIPVEVPESAVDVDHVSEVPEVSDDVQEQFGSEIQDVPEDVEAPCEEFTESREDALELDDMVVVPTVPPAFYMGGAEDPEVQAEAKVADVDVPVISGVRGVTIDTPPSEACTDETQVLVDNVLEAVPTGDSVVTEHEAVPLPPVERKDMGFDQSGEGIRPLSDPQVRRPRSVRFRFNNGVLQNVDRNEGSEEGSRRPLE